MHDSTKLRIISFLGIALVPVILFREAKSMKSWSNGYLNFNSVYTYLYLP